MTKKPQKNDFSSDEMTLPLLPLRDIVIFPHMVVPLFVGREKSIAALDRAKEKGKYVVLAAQREAKNIEPGPEDIFLVATVGKIVQMLRLPDGTLKVLVEGKHRVHIKGFTETDDVYMVTTEQLEHEETLTKETEAQMRLVKSTFENYTKLNKRIPPEMLVTLQTVTDPSHLADSIAAHLSTKLPEKQQILEILEPSKRLRYLQELMLAEIEILQMQKKIRSRVKKQMEKNQREYYLNEQMQAIQKELGGRDEFKNEINELAARIKEKNLPKEPNERDRKSVV